MKRISEHREPEFTAGADALVRTLARLTETIVVVSDRVRDGFRLKHEVPPSRIRFQGDAGSALSFAAGLALTGRRVSVLLDTDRLSGARAQLEAALLRMLSLTVIVARGVDAEFDPIEELGGTGCPVLCASGAQSLVDLCVVADAVAKTAMLPVVISASSRRGLWTYQQLAETPLIEEIPPGDALRFFRKELLGEDTPKTVAWVDPANPMASRIAAPGDVQLKRRLGRKIFVGNELPALIDRAMAAFSMASGRTYAAVQSSSDKPSDTVLLNAGTADGAVGQLAARVSGFAAVNITRVRPFPADSLRSHVVGARKIGVLSEVNEAVGNVSSLVDDVKTALAEDTTDERRPIWKRGAGREEAGRSVVPVWHAPGWTPRAGDLDALAQRLAQPEMKTDLLVAGARMGDPEVRLPAVEETLQRMARSGISFSEFEVRGAGGERAAGQVVAAASSVQSLWPMLQDICGLLASGGALNIHGSLHPASGAAAYPVIGSVTFDADIGDPAFVICPEPGLLLAPLVREMLPDGAVVLTYHVEGEKWPFWMLEKRLHLHVFPAQDDHEDAAVPFLFAFAKLHPSLRAVPDKKLLQLETFSAADPALLAEKLNEVHEAGPDAFEAAGRRPPESIPPAELKDRTPASLPVADLDRFWKSLGHLRRTAHLSASPVDAFLTGSYLPASTASLSERGGGTGMPDVIPERCTGCGACWSVCPESAVMVRPFSVESLWNAALASSSKAFVQLPRLAPAILKTAHRLVKEDELHRYATAGDLFIEAFARVLDKAGLEGEKRAAIETERDALLQPIARIRLNKAESWFDEREAAGEGQGVLLGIGIDAAACTSCGLCVAACGDEALEYVDVAHGQREWLQLADLPTLPGEDDPAAHFEHPAAALAGNTSRRVFRMGSSDTSNLNRTVLRLFLEAGHVQASRIRRKVLDEVDETIARIDARLQETIDESVRINDFDRFSRELSEAGRDLGGLFEDRSEGLTDRLGLLTACRQALKAEKSRLASETRGDLRAHMVLVDATFRRSLGLAPYPDNPFSMPYVRAETEDAAGLIAGITQGLIARYEELGRQLRTARQTLDDVLDSTKARETLPEDAWWARSVLPLVVLVTDQIDFSTLGVLETGPHVRVLALSGAGPADLSEVGIDAAALIHLLDDIWLSRATVSDPVRLLKAFCEGMAGEHAALFQVYAPDPLRDGVQVDEALGLSGMAGRSGVFLPFTKEPGKPVVFEGISDKSVCAADWMIGQNRYAHCFEVIPAAGWSSDQVQVAGWIGLSGEQKAKVEPYVERAGRRYRPSETALAYSEAVNRSIEKMAARTGGAVQPGLSPEAVKTQRVEQPAPATVHADALAALTEKLLALSGYAGSEETLAGWQKRQNEVATE